MPGKADVISIGEVMIRLAPYPGVRLEDARSFNVEVGGAECNVMVCLSSLGRRCAWISKLADNELGRLVLRRVRQTGVDVSRIVWEEGARTGTYFVEFGMVPRPSKIIYDRKNSAASLLRPEEIDWEFVGRFNLIHLTGITPALSRSSEAVVKEAVRRARESGQKISLDVNYRSKLWKPSRALRSLNPLIRGVDILTVTRSDANTLFGLDGSPEDVLRHLSKRYGADVTVLTLGPEGALALKDGELHKGVGYEVQEVDRIGAGDAFAAGFLHGYIDGDVQRGVEMGSAMAALKHTVKGDFLSTSKDEVLDIIRRRDTAIRR